MKPKTLRFRNDKALRFFEERFKGDTDQVLLESALFELVRPGVISGGKAGDLLGVSRWDLPALLTKHNVDTVPYSVEALEKETATLTHVQYSAA